VTRGRVAAAALAVACAAAAHAQPGETIAQRWAGLCAGCHGAQGVSTTADTPSLAGLGGFYAATQLFLFRAGRRTNAAMTAVGKTLTDDDLRGFSAWIGKLPPRPPPEGTPDPARMARGRELAAQHRCLACHGADLSGDDKVPGLAGQREDYLRRALHEFKAGQRVGYTNSMNEALAPVDKGDLDTLAHFLANFR
jgi:cytochrome c553